MSRSADRYSLMPHSRREVPDVPEARLEDRSLDLLLKLRKQRIERHEQERGLARAEWRRQRNGLHEAKERWRKSVQDAKDFWQEARAGFLGMVTTSGQYNRAKAIYGKMKEHAAQLYLECQEAVSCCTTSRRDFFEACRKLREARLQHEKLGMLRDEIRRLQRQNES